MDRKRLIGELEALHRERYRQFLRVAVAIAGDEPGGHDAVQEGFARAIRASDSFRGDGTVEAWLWQVVVNAARAARHRQPDPTEITGEPVSNGRPADDEAVIRAWVAALPERQRLAVFLRYYADLDYRAIATALRVEVGAVSATLSAAHSALRRSLREVPR